jgi:hypothetical protein
VVQGSPLETAPADLARGPFAASDVLEHRNEKRFQLPVIGNQASADRIGRLHDLVESTIRATAAKRQRPVAQAQNRHSTLVKDARSAVEANALHPQWQRSTPRGFVHSAHILRPSQGGHLRYPV